MIDRAAYVEPGTIGPACPPLQHCRHATCRAIRDREDGADRRMIAFMRRNLDAIRQDEAAGQLARDIRRLRTRIEAAIDNRDPDVYYGPCQADAVETTEQDGVVITTLLPGVKCGADLIGELDARAVTCPDCGTVWDTDELQDWLTEKSRDAWARPSVIVAALRARGEDITIEKLKNWIARDKAEHDAGRTRWVPYPPILALGVEPRLDGDGRPVMTPLLDDQGEPKRDEAGRPILIDATRPVYRLGDVLARIEALAAIDKQRREGRDAG